MISPEHISVFVLGLNIWPSTRTFDKNKLSRGVFQFIRCHKLKEYFFEKMVAKFLQQLQPKTNIVIESGISGLIKIHPGIQRWSERDADSCYSNLWKTGQSGIMEKLKSYHNKTYNKLTTSWRNWLSHLANDDSTVIKMADKRGAIVIINKKTIFRFVK